MKIHEYQAKEILRRFGVVTPRGVACFSVDEAVAAAQKLGGSMVNLQVGEVYSSLQKGTIDGAFGPITGSMAARRRSSRLMTPKTPRFWAEMKTRCGFEAS